MQDGKARRNELICDAFFCLTTKEFKAVSQSRLLRAISCTHKTVEYHQIRGMTCFPTIPKIRTAGPLLKLEAFTEATLYHRHNKQLSALPFSEWIGRKSRKDSGGRAK